MAEEKPFEPTSARLARAKRDGDLPRSHDLVAAASFAGAIAATLAALPFEAAAARAALVDAARSLQASPGPSAVVVACAFVTLGGAIAAALAASYLQTRALVFKAPAPAFQKLDPVRGLKRMASRDSALAAAKALTASAAVTVAIFPAFRDALAFGGAGTAAGLAARAGRATVAVVVSALAVAAAFAAVDVALERTKWLRRLRMSLHELKRDHRQSDGDPQVKGRRRQAHRSLLRGSLARLADAAFVVANPTHVAIALEYRPPAVAVPRVLVRATGDAAVRVKGRARELRIPIVENVALARALLASTRAGDAIPVEAYAAVAAIVAALQIQLARA